MVGQDLSVPYAFRSELVNPYQTASIRRIASVAAHVSPVLLAWHSDKKPISSLSIYITSPHFLRGI